MKLSASGKNKLMESANKVYLAYTALDFFKSRTFLTADDGQKSLYELCKKALADGNNSLPVTINNSTYTLTLTPEKNNSFAVRFIRPATSPRSSLVVKKITDYDDQDALNLLAHQSFTLEIPLSGGEPAVANKLNRDYVIGGSGKVDLYRTHLVTLHKIIEKIESEEDISNLLVALATGSGKTFVQALWLLVLSLSKNNGIFAVPDNLASQFVKDVKRLLPDKLVNSILTLREGQSSPQVEKTLKSLVNPHITGKMIVASSECLLDNHYQDMMDANSEHTFLAFDEQHLIMKTERRRVRLIELSKKKLSMFLTATPNEETYVLSGNKPVAIMSNSQKQEAGQGQFPHIFTLQARNISDRNKLKDYRFWTKAFWKNMFNGFILRLMNSIQHEQSSSAVTLIEELPFSYHRKKGENSLRWGLQFHSARKMLCVIDDNETLVNFCYTLQHAPTTKRDVYSKGNVINRDTVAEFFLIPEVEREVIRQDMKDKRDKHLASLQGEEREIVERMINKPLKQQLKDNIFHSFIEYILMDITGLDQIEQNRLRKQDMPNFQQLVVSRYSSRTAEYYQKKLAKELDPVGAKEIGQLLAHLSSELGAMIKGTFDANSRQNKKDLTDFIDNWSLYDALITKLLNRDWRFTGRFKTYAEDHLIMGVMSGMKDAETPVVESRPFLGMNLNINRLYDENGVLKSTAKKRKHSSLEILNDHSEESTFTPTYLDVPEEIADNYNRLGFAGVYVSNKKSEGYSDRNVHTVVNLAEKTLSKTNSPQTQVQILGRLRGLDGNEDPVFIHSLGRNQKPVFDLKHLQSDDYYPPLFKAQAEYNKEYVSILGSEVSHKILHWIHANLSKDDTVNPDRLKRQVLKFIAQALRELNNKNSHKIKLSRAQLANVVHYVMKDIDQELDKIQKPYEISLPVRILGFICNFIAECFYSVKRIPAAFKMYLHSWAGRRATDKNALVDKHADDVYIKILSNTTYKKLVSKMFSVRELINWLARKTDGAQEIVKKNAERYIKKEVSNQFQIHRKEFLEPLITKMVIDSRKEQVARALAAFPQFITLFYANEEVLNDLRKKDVEQFEAKLLSVLQQIPGLEDLTRGDMVNYPKNMDELQKQLSEKSLSIMAHDSDLHLSLAQQIGSYLKGGFLKQLSSFVVYGQVKKVEQLLAEEDSAQEFVRHCLSKLIKNEINFTPEAIFKEFKIYFSMEELNRLDEEGLKLQHELKKLQDSIKENWADSIDKYSVDAIISIIKTQILPGLVNVYPREQRKKLLDEATDDLKIRKLMTAHAAEIASVPEKNQNQLPDFIFSKLINGPLPKQIDLGQVETETKALFKKKFSEILGMSKTSLAFGKVFSPSTWSIKKRIYLR